MSSARYTPITAVLFLLFCQLAAPAYAQYGITFDVKKPKEFENRVLRSEKSDQKKFTVPRRFIQNTITHYNYFFNANNKLNEVLDRAKQGFRDDYSKLIPFYNYSLDLTAADSIQLDSISYKAQTGIILHDLRGDWADNMYLLWGASYYLKKQFDSAYLMFQFINYAFAAKEKDGYYRNIGSARDGNSASSISTKEKKSFTRELFSQPPSRNDAFIWQIRNHLAQDHFTEAGSLILALKNDSLFPGRLQNDLEEVQAYYFYRQQMWDSTAAHLEKALSNATNKQEQARWEYLLGQLYETTGKYDLSEEYYTKSIGHTTDPIMDIYARLGSVRVNKDEGEKAIEKNIETLVKMARRDKYLDYRDIIYFMAAQMELERKNIDGALALLLKSTKVASNNPTQRNKAFLQLAELSFQKKLYRPSYNFYDSLDMGDTALKNPEQITARKTILATLANNIEIIERQDSLQRLAALPEEERKDIIKKMVRKLRKQQGLKDEGVATTTGSNFPGNNQPPTTLFNDNKKGEWYFYSNTSRQKGLNDFKAKWGTRPNTDNWRRSAAQVATVRSQPDRQSQLQNERDKAGNQEEQKEITFENLNDRIPLTEPKLKQSNDSIQDAMMTLGLVYIQQLEDCAAGTSTLEELRTRFPKHRQMDEVLFNLYYCYQKQGEPAKAAAVRNQISQQYPKSNFTTIITTGKNPQDKGPANEATRTYEQIYDLFIEGKFGEAIAEKRKADSAYGKIYWTPQLLYIEAVYYIKQREDSVAKGVLNNIIISFAGTPLSEKAATMLDVLNRRSEIEEELRNLVIERPTEDTTTRYRGDVAVTPPAKVQEPVVKDSVITEPVMPPVVKAPVRSDTALTKPVTIAPSTAPAITANLPKTGGKDSTGIKPVTKPVDPTAFQFVEAAPYAVVVLLNKVDPIFVSEARNAFYRYNRNVFYNKQMQAELVEIDADNRLLLINPFKDLQEALAYVDQTKPKTASEILPWLKGGKYTYLIITDRNLEILKNTKDIEKYKAFLETHLPGKFQ